MSKVITISIPKDDLVALTAASAMLMEIARQKARTPSNAEYVAEANQMAKEQAAAEGRGCQTLKDQCDCYAETEPDTIAYSSPPIYSQTAQAVTDPADGLIDAIAAFAGAPLETVNVIPAPPVDPGFAERTAHLNGTMHTAPPLPPMILSDGTTVEAPYAGPPTVVCVPLQSLAPGAHVEVDSRGLPWDRRIHSATKNKCKTGEWKNIKGVDKDMLASVEIELQNAMAGVASAVVVAQTTIAPPVVQTVIPTVPQPVVPPAPSVATPPVPPTTPTGCPTSFPEFLQVVTGKCTARVLSYDEVTQTCQKHGLAGIPLLGARPDLIPVVYAELEALWLSRS